MDIEDEILEDLQEKEREVERAREEARREAEARKRAEKERKKAEARKKAEEEKKRLMRKLAFRMLKDKEPIEKIIEETGLSEEEIREIAQD